MRSKPKLRLKRKPIGDPVLIIATTLLIVFGTAMVFSASYYYALNTTGNAYHYLIRQIIWVITGLLLLLFASNIDYHVWAKFWFFSYIAGLVLLIAVLFIGSEAYGATRWIYIGPITLMPGELAKIFIIFFITGYLSRHPKWGKDLQRGILPIVGLTLVYALLIYKQPNMSTAVTVCFIAGGMLIVAGMSFKYVAGLVALGGAAGTFLILADRSGYKYGRFLSFMDPFEDVSGDGWNVVQSLLALGTGGVTGLGLGQSVQKNLYLPMPQNDFILAIVGEELGLLGILFLVFLYVIFIWRGCKIAMNANDYTGMMLASGVAMTVGIQVVINFAVVTSSMPPTGIILPFISYGGNALWIFMFLTGILLNISKSKKSHL